MEGKMARNVRLKANGGKKKEKCQSSANEK